MGVLGRKAEMGPRPGRGGEFQQARGHCPSPFPLAVLVSPELARNNKKGKISAGERINTKITSFIGSLEFCSGKSLFPFLDPRGKVLLWSEVVLFYY